MPAIAACSAAAPVAVRSAHPRPSAPAKRSSKPKPAALRDQKPGGQTAGDSRPERGRGGERASAGRDAAASRARSRCRRAGRRIRGRRRRSCSPRRVLPADAGEGDRARPQHIAADLGERQNLGGRVAHEARPNRGPRARSRQQQPTRRSPSPRSARGGSSRSRQSPARRPQAANGLPRRRRNG